MIIPAKGRLLIKKIDRKEIKTDSGLFMPGQALQEESLYYGEVVSVAKMPSDEFVTRTPHGVTYNFPYKVGDKVFYSRYSATKVVDETGADFLIVSDLDVMAHDTSTTRK